MSKFTETLTNIFEPFKRNRAAIIWTIGLGALLVGMVLGAINANSTLNDLEAELADITSQEATIQSDIETRRAELELLRKESITEATGINNDIVVNDQAVAAEFFEPAFNWKNGEDYNNMRTHYEGILGESNSFTKTYLPPDTVIDTEDGTLQFIDHESLMATLRNVYIVPTAVDSNTVKYVAFVEYIMHRSEDGLGNPDRLESSHAIVDFTMSGSGSDRKISAVNARPGFITDPTVN